MSKDYYIPLRFFKRQVNGAIKSDNITRPHYLGPLCPEVLNSNTDQEHPSTNLGYQSIF